MSVRVATIAAATGFAASLLIAGPAAHGGYYKSITVDGNTSDWADVPVATTDAADFATGVDLVGVKVANDATKLYVLLQFGHAINPQSPDVTYLGVDSDNNVATGFNIYGRNLVGSEAGYTATGFPFSQKTGVFNSGSQTNNEALIGNYNTVVTEQEISYSLAALDDVGHKVFPDSFSLLYYGTDANADDSGVVHYSLAAVPEPAMAGVLAAGVAAGCLRRQRGRRAALA